MVQLDQKQFDAEALMTSARLIEQGRRRGHD